MTRNKLDRIVAYWRPAKESGLMRVVGVLVTVLLVACAAPSVQRPAVTSSVLTSPSAASSPTAVAPPPAPSLPATASPNSCGIIDKPLGNLLAIEASKVIVEADGCGPARIPQNDPPFVATKREWAVAYAFTCSGRFEEDGLREVFTLAARDIATGKDYDFAVNFGVFGGDPRWVSGAALVGPYVSGPGSYLILVKVARPDIVRCQWRISVRE